MSKNIVSIYEKETCDDRTTFFTNKKNDGKHIIAIIQYIKDNYNLNSINYLNLTSGGRYFDKCFIESGLNISKYILNDIDNDKIFPNEKKTEKSNIYIKNLDILNLDNLTEFEKNIDKISPLILNINLLIGTSKDKVKNSYFNGYLETEFNKEELLSILSIILKNKNFVLIIKENNLHITKDIKQPLPKGSGFFDIN